METNAEKPLISILMAVYEPRLDWLREQLESLNAQTYPNLRLYVRDDCSPTVPFGDILACIEDCVRAFPWTAVRNEKNLGSNGAFQLLTEEAEGDYFAYCDQDDVWLPEKLTALESQAAACAAVMSYSDMAVVDRDGRVVAGSLRDIRPRLRYMQGGGLADAFFFRNCAAGCCTLFRSSVAKGALPFPRQTVYDQWLALTAAQSGKVAFSSLALVRYRQHGGNQTGILTGVTDKASYRRLRLEPLAERLEQYRRRALPSPRVEAFVLARLAGDAAGIWRYRSLSPFEACFELFMKILPESVFQKVVQKLK